MMNYFMRLQNCPVVQGSLTLNLVKICLSLSDHLCILDTLFYLSVYKHVVLFHPFMLCTYDLLSLLARLQVTLEGLVEMSLLYKVFSDAFRQK